MATIAQTNKDLQKSIQKLRESQKKIAQANKAKADALRRISGNLGGK